MYEIINNVPIKIKEYKGHRVVTLKDIDMVHNRPEGTARKRFNDNRERFIKGEDFFFVKSEDIQMSEIRTFEFEVPNRGIILLTESGYLMLVKSFTDELAWDVQRKLVNTYFKVNKTDVPYAVSRSDIKAIFNAVLDDRIGTLEKNISILKKSVNTLEKNISELDKKIDSLEKKSEKIASDTCVTLRPAFIQLHDKINENDKKFEKFSANFAAEISGRLRPYFRSLDNKIKGFAKSSDRKSESISKAVGDNTKLMSAYLDTLANMLNNK